MSTQTQYRPMQISFDFSAPPAPKKEQFISGSISNIKEMLPYLYEHQVEDIARAEKRFLVGKGIMFTNGTGVGKTFIGLGLAKRFFVQGKKEILIVAPTDQKCTDWVYEGNEIGLNVHKVIDTNDKGHQISVVTYANFYQNTALDSRIYDLVIYDESHYLNQNQKGSETVYYEKHKKVVKLPSKARSIATNLCGPYPSRDNHIDIHKARLEWAEKHERKTKDLVDRTKVLYLSATPFAYHKSIMYADGTLFNAEETLEIEEDTYKSYNEPNKYESFMIENFGYQMRYGKLQIPETGVDVSLLERNFFENMSEKGIMYTRQLELDKDYSRHFPKVSNDLGDKIDEGMKMFHNEYMKENYQYLSYFAKRQYNYLFINQLLECIKAQEVYKRVNLHLKLGRKVVIFHTYNNSKIKHPFKFDADELTKKDEKHLIRTINDEIKLFNEEFPELINLPIDELKNTREEIKSRFPDALEINGTIPKKKRSDNLKKFNLNSSGYDIIIVQTKAGREGISLHDKVGDKPRVLINLGLPTAPTEAIQSEGRIYRAGLKSNAIYEYPTMQTTFEKTAFAEKVSTRSKTAENLAMGNLARDLETAYKEGYNNWTIEDPSLDQGVGGKEDDRIFNSISEFDKAKTFYWKRAKKTNATKAKEGVDYFATPEPLGLKMVEWLDPQPNEKGMEPSAGHGAIARWFPEFTINHFIEPSYELYGELSLNTSGTCHNIDFEKYYIGQKFNYIAMNPPFGKGGKTAIEHLKKALKQMNWRDSRLMAIIPEGSMMERRLESIYHVEDYGDPQNKLFANCKHVLTIRLPEVLFARAGTKTKCKIVMFEHSTMWYDKLHREIDLSNCETIDDFFNKIEFLQI